MTDQRALALYLTFDNAVLFAMAMLTLIVFIDYLRFRMFAESGGVVAFVRKYYFERKDFLVEIVSAIAVTLLGLAWRALWIYLWRLKGSSASDFPFFLTAVGDMIMIFGMACIIRLLARQVPRNWPWLASIGISLLFGAASVLLII